jgi:hypothetical protein
MTAAVSVFRPFDCCLDFVGTLVSSLYAGSIALVYAGLEAKPTNV